MSTSVSSSLRFSSEGDHVNNFINKNINCVVGGSLGGSAGTRLSLSQFVGE
jgi:hypothetical protein